MRDASVCRSGQLSSDRDIDGVSEQLRESMDLERTHVHPIFYDLALEIAQLKTKKKGAAAISAFQRERNPPTLSPPELESIFDSDASAKLVQVVYRLAQRLEFLDSSNFAGFPIRD
jgi:hypothetical protein